MKGKLIVIEGTDGSGKATQARLLVDHLKTSGKDTIYLEFPQYGQPSAAMVEEYLHGNLGEADEVGPYRASVLYAIDRYARSKDIRKWLDEGKIIICNRYTTANKGHQAGKIKDKDSRDKFLAWLDDFEYNLLGIPRPDKVILLHMPCELGQRLIASKGDRAYLKGKQKDIHEADLSHLKAAEEAYLYVAEKEAWTIIPCAKGDEARPIANIAEDLREALGF